ncbi:hypothetical protein [Cerasicoccus frondis]|uniref:hypothetical protein n=1 Tax=Cerasicoccus frondis TaxID=490090 RepID=UPI0028525B74|nr:hypothetical protein [Cerasicoccus frondis]
MKRGTCGGVSEEHRKKVYQAYFYHASHGVVERPLSMAEVQGHYYTEENYRPAIRFITNSMIEVYYEPDTSVWYEVHFKQTENGRRVEGFAEKHRFRNGDYYTLPSEEKVAPRTRSGSQ